MIIITKLRLFGYKLSIKRVKRKEKKKKYEEERGWGEGLYLADCYIFYNKSTCEVTN